MARASPSDLVTRYDERVIKDLASDTGVPGATNSARVLEALETATGYFEAAVLVGGVYTLEDLDGLTGSALSLAKTLICDLALLQLVGARVEVLGKDNYEAVRARVESYLTQLRNGARLFPLPRQIDAGQPSTYGPTAADYARLNLLPERAKRYYPSRASRLPIGRA